MARNGVKCFKYGIGKFILTRNIMVWSNIQNSIFGGLSVTSYPKIRRNDDDSKCCRMLKILYGHRLLNLKKFDTFIPVSQFCGGREGR